jgi:hypothetical protein
MRKLTPEDIEIVNFIVKKEARKEAIEILEKCPIRNYNEFMNYHNMDKDNVCCLVLDFTKDELVKCNEMKQNKKDFFGNVF